MTKKKQFSRETDANTLDFAEKWPLRVHDEESNGLTTHESENTGIEPAAAKVGVVARQEVDIVTITVPLMVGELPEGYQSTRRRHMEVQLPPRQGDVMRRLFAALDLDHARTADGVAVHAQHRALLWLLDQLAAKLPAGSDVGK